MTTTLLAPSEAMPEAMPEQHRDAEPTLADLLYEGFYLVYLLHHGDAPSDAAGFAARVTDFLDGFERQAKRHHYAAEDIFDAKYAFCAAVDEAVLATPSAMRDAWERQPLQLILFGDQLAGEHFFEKLETARRAGRTRLAVLEVFHFCLLLGFKGRYLLEGPEKLAYFTAQLGEQIAHLKGRSAGFAPHWARPDDIVHRLRRAVPVWALSAVLALAGLLAFVWVRDHAAANTAAAVAGYEDIVTLPPRPPHVTITLP